MNHYNSNSSNAFGMSNLSTPGAGFGGRARLNNKRLSVALPPKVDSISENSTELPTPRTSRSHLLAGLRTQPKNLTVPASAPYHQTQHVIPSQNNNSYNRNYIPMTAALTAAPGNGYASDYNNQYVSSVGHQMYALPQQVLAPPQVYEQAEEMDPNVLQQMQMTSLFLAQRKQQLQQQLNDLTVAAQNMNLNGMAMHNGFVAAQQMQQPNIYASPQIQEVPGQPGLYMIYNAATQSYQYFTDPNAQQYTQKSTTASEQNMSTFANTGREGQGYQMHNVERALTPPKKTPSPPTLQQPVEPLPPPSSNAFRRGHKKASSLAISAINNVADGPKTSSAAVFGSQRSMIPPTPMTGMFGPGGARAGEHPERQPRGPPSTDELEAAPTSKHEGSKNFATRQRRRALDNLVKAGTQRRGNSRSATNSPASEGDFSFRLNGDDALPRLTGGCRKMSPIGSEMKEKRGSHGSSDGYFGLSSASSSEGEETGAYKLPLTPGLPAVESESKKKMLTFLSNNAERRQFGM